MAQVTVTLAICLRCDGRKAESGDMVELNLNPAVLDQAIIDAYSPVTGTIVTVLEPGGGTPATAAMLLVIEVEDADLPPGLINLSEDHIYSVSCIGCCDKNKDLIDALDARVVVLEALPNVQTSVGGSGAADDGKTVIFSADGNLLSTKSMKVIDEDFPANIYLEMLSTGVADQRISIKQNTLFGHLNFPQLASDVEWGLPMSGGNIHTDLTNTTVLHLPGTSALVGGASTDLDYLATEDLPVGTCVLFRLASGARVFYTLIDSIVATDEPRLIRPVDFALATNEKVWSLDATNTAALYLNDPASEFFVTLIASGLTADRIKYLSQHAGYLEDAPNYVTTIPSEGFSQDHESTINNVIHYLNPAGALTAGTVLLPEDGVARERQRILVASSQDIGTLTFACPTGTFLSTAAIAITAEDVVEWECVTTTPSPTWLRIR